MPKENPLGDAIAWVVVMAFFFGLMLLVHFVVDSGPVAWFFLLSVVGFFLLWIIVAGRKDDEDKGEIAKLTPRLRTRIVDAILEDAKRACKFFACGTGLAWTWQTIVNFGRDGFSSNNVGQTELWIYDFCHRLSEYSSLKYAIAIIFVSILISAVLESWWPLAIAGKLRKTGSTVVAMLTGFSMFTLVGIASASPQYEKVAEPIRAQIIQNIDATMQARRNHAAMQWLVLLVNRPDIQTEKWRTNLSLIINTARDSCDSINHQNLDRQTPVCRHDDVDRVILNSEFDFSFIRASTSKPEEQQRVGDWLPEITTTIPEVSSSSVNKPDWSRLNSMNLAQLKALAIKLTEINDAAKDGEASMRSVVTKAVGGLFDPELGGLVGKAVEIARDALIGEMLKEATPAIKSRLASLTAPSSTVTLDTLPAIKLNSPIGDAAALSRSDLVSISSQTVEIAVDYNVDRAKWEAAKAKENAEIRDFMGWPSTPKYGSSKLVDRNANPVRGGSPPVRRVGHR